jgi:hypothetical protein
MINEQPPTEAHNHRTYLGRVKGVPKSVFGPAGFRPTGGKRTWMMITGCIGPYLNSSPLSSRCIFTIWAVGFSDICPSSLYRGTVAQLIKNKSLLISHNKVSFPAVLSFACFSCSLGSAPLLHLFPKDQGHCNAVTTMDLWNCKRSFLHFCIVFWGHYTSFCKSKICYW